MINFIKATVIASIFAAVQIDAFDYQSQPYTQVRDIEKTPLMEASSNGNIKKVMTLIENGAKPDLEIIDGYAALMCAASYGHIGVVEYLIEKGAKPDLQNIHGTTALILASRAKQYDAAKILLEQKANPNVRNTKNSTALIGAACKVDNINVVNILLEYDADPNYQNNDGYTALIRASARCDISVGNALLLKDADPNLVTNEDSFGGLNTALMLASKYGIRCNDLVKNLIEHGANLNLRNSDGRTALILAANDNGIDNYHYEVLETLIKKGAQLDWQDRYGMTALMYAAGGGQLKVVKLLLKHNADPTISNNKGETAEQIALNKGHYIVSKRIKWSMVF